jgi:hypothetical protein
MGRWLDWLRTMSKAEPVRPKIDLGWREKASDCGEPCVDGKPYHGFKPTPEGDYICQYGCGARRDTVSPGLSSSW